jgi:hypothetical protein
MIKVIFLLKRKEGITHEQFREHYEKSHAVLGQKYFGHLLTGYVRNYVGDVRSSRSQGGRPVAWGYDCVTEFMLPSEEALNELYGLFAHSVIGKDFYDDEERFLDRDAVLSIVCREGDVVDTGPGTGWRTAELLSAGEQGS